MTPEATHIRSPRFRLSYLLMLLVLSLGYRVFLGRSEFLFNTSPLMAICFGGGLLFGRQFWWVPALLLFGTDMALTLSGGNGLGSHSIFLAVLYSLAGLAGMLCSIHARSWPLMLGGTLVATVVFYMAGNTFAWLSSPAYSKTMAGWWQSQTIGDPNWEPKAYFFLRNALISNILWCVAALPLFNSKSTDFEEDHKAAPTLARHPGE